MPDAKPAAIDLAALLLRLALGAIFTYHGAQKLGLLDPALGWGTTTAAVTAFADALGKLGLEPALPLAWATALTELVGGAFLLVGLATRGAAVGMIVIMAVAIAKVHGEVGFGPERLPLGGGVRPGYEFNLLIVAASAALVVLGAGGLSLDRWVANKRERK